MPQYIAGPALIRRAGVTLYSESGIDLDFVTKSDTVTSDLHGPVDEKVISRMMTISFKPVDMIGNLAALFSLGIDHIGDTIFRGSSRAVASVSVANPSVITTSAPHNLGPNTTTIPVTLAGFNTTPDINGVKLATITGASTFTIPVNVSVVTTGTGTVTPVGEPLQIVSKNDSTIHTFGRSGPYEYSDVHLGASKGFFGSNTQFAVLGSVTKDPTDADYWEKAVAAAFVDTGFDETKLKRYRYTATFDGLTGITAQSGFDISIKLDKDEIPDDNVGIGDIHLKGVTLTSKFTPSGLTIAQVDALIRLQGAGALQPGDSIAGAGDKDFVISGEDDDSDFTATLHGHGFANTKRLWATGKLRHGEVGGMSKRTWAAGTASPLYTFSVS